MAPEVIDSKPFSFESDVWSLGCVVFELCCKEKPFNACGGQMAIMAQILNADPKEIPAMYSDEFR